MAGKARALTRARATATALRLAMVMASALALMGTAAPVPAARAAGGLTLEEAWRAAEAGNPAYRRACLAVDQAELALARLEADRSVRAGALALQQAEGARDTARAARDAARRKLRLDVRRAYYTLLTARQQQQVAREALDQAQEQRRVILGRRGPGAATELEALTAERALAEAKAGVERAETGARLAELTLLDLLGWPADTTLALDETASASSGGFPGEPAAIALALERSPEVRQAREAVKAAHLAVSLAENDYTPALSRQAAQARLAEANLGVEEAERRVALQVRRAAAEVHLAEAGVDVAAKTVLTAAEGYRAAKARFAVGASGTEELLAAQVRLFQARQAGLQAKLDLDLARAALLSLIGE